MTGTAVIAEPRSHRWVRLVLAGVAWVGLIVWWVVYQRRTGSGAVDTAQRLIDAASGNWWAIVAYMAVSLIRPLVQFPATIVAVAAGILFGPFVGVGVAALAANASAMVGYSIGRNLRRPGAESAVTSQLGTWSSRRCEQLRSSAADPIAVLAL